MGVSSKYGHVTVEKEPGNPINGTEEPIFILRARDSVSLLTLTMYEQAAMGAGASPTIARGMREELHRFKAWQKANSHLVKTPD